MNKFQWTKENKIHLSVGAVVINEEGLIAVHKLERIGNKIFLPKKTHQNNNTLEDTLNIVLDKELGVEASIVKFLGGHNTIFGDPNSGDINKTTLYFLCKLNRITERDIEDRDADSRILWLSPSEFIDTFKSQNVADLDASEIISRI